jgi:hypothetical protein
MTEFHGTEFHVDDAIALANELHAGQLRLRTKYARALQVLA